MISEHGSPLELDGMCWSCMHACQLHMCLLHLHSMCLVHLHDVNHGCSDAVMWKLMFSLWSASA